MRKNWVTNWRPYSIPHSAINCFQWTPDSEPPAVLWLIIGCKVTNKWAKHQIYLSIFERENSNSFAWLVQELRDIVSKVIILFERTKSRLNFLFWACSSLTKQIAASFGAPAKKVRIRYVLLPNYLLMANNWQSIWRIQKKSLPLRRCLEVLGQAKRTSSSSHVRKYSNKFGISLVFS